MPEATGQWAETRTGCRPPGQGLASRMPHLRSQRRPSCRLSPPRAGLFFLPGAKPRAVLQSRVRGRRERHLRVPAACLLQFCALEASLASPWAGAAVPESHSPDRSPGRTLQPAEIPRPGGFPSLLPRTLVGARDRTENSGNKRILDSGWILGLTDVPGHTLSPSVSVSLSHASP